MVVALLGTEFVRVEAVIVVGAIWCLWWCLWWFVVVCGGDGSGAGGGGGRVLVVA